MRGGQHVQDVYAGKADYRDPGEALNIATMPMDLPGGPLARAGETVLGAGGVRRGEGVSPAILSQLADLYTSGHSKTKHTIPIDEWSAVREATGELAPKKLIEPADLQGKLLIGEMWDRTLGGHRLTGVGGRPLAEPVELQGGLTFQRGAAAQGPDRAITASDLGQVNRVAGFAQREAERTGRQPVLAPSIMGERSGDFPTCRPWRRWDNSRGQRSCRSTSRPSTRRCESEYPAFAGVEGAVRDPAALREQFLAPKAGGLRKAFAETAAAGEWTKKGFPDPGQTRWAISDPELAFLPTGSSGLTFADIAPGASRSRARPFLTHLTRRSFRGRIWAASATRSTLRRCIPSSSRP